MTPKEVIDILVEKGISKYKIAKVMGMQPIMVDKFITEQQKTIRREAANALYEEWGLLIDDNYINGYQKQMFIDKHNNLVHD